MMRARSRTLYLLIFANVIVLTLSIGTLIYARSLANRLSTTEERNYASCVRGNTLREGYRFSMKKLGSPERARQPEVQEQDCARIYPGGAR